MIISPNLSPDVKQLIIEIENQTIASKSCLIKRTGKIALWIFANVIDWGLKKLRKQLKWTFDKKENIHSLQRLFILIHEAIKKLLAYCFDPQLEKKFNQVQVEAERILSNQFSTAHLADLHALTPYCQQLNFAFLTLLIDSTRLSNFISPAHKSIIKEEHITLLTEMIQSIFIPLTKPQFHLFIQENVYVFQWLSNSDFSYSHAVDESLKERLHAFKQDYKNWTDSHVFNDENLSKKEYVKQILKKKLEAIKEKQTYISKKDLVKSLHNAVSPSSFCQRIRLPLGSHEDEDILNLLTVAGFKAKPDNKFLFKRQHLFKQKIRKII